MNAPSKVKKPDKPTGVISIHGREYQTVAYRVQRFREAHPSYGLTTSIIDRDPECVVVQAAIADETGRTLATGHAEEVRKASQINKTSALENAETSAIGRALAALGFGGTEFATANEVQNAIHQQNDPADEGKTSDCSPKEQDGDLAPTALKASLKLLVHHVNGAGDLDELVAILETEDSKLVMEQCERRAPAWWETGEGMPAEFTPLKELIANRRKDLEAADTAVSYVRAG